MAGYELRTIVLNDATATAGGYGPVQAATNARNLTEDPSVVAGVGPIDSGSAKAMLPILSQAGLAMVAGSTTSPDLTNPKFAAQTRQNGAILVFFRTRGNEAFVEPGMANFFYDKHNVRCAYILDDGGAGGKGIADAFQMAAGKKGSKSSVATRSTPRNLTIRRSARKLMVLSLTCSNTAGLR